MVTVESDLTEPAESALIVSGLLDEEAVDGRDSSAGFCESASLASKEPKP